MKTFPIEITVEAENEEQALEKLTAFAKMDAALEHDDFIAMAEFVEENPNTITLVKSELPKVKNLSGMQIAMQAPSLIAKIQEAQKLDDAL